GHPERVTAIVSQNGNAYEEGLSDAWDPIRSYWAKPTTENRKTLRDALLNFEGTRWQYTHGVSNAEAVAPESYTLDAALLERPGKKYLPVDSVFNRRFDPAPLPSFKKVLPRRQPAAARHLGQACPFLSSARRRGVPP